MNELEIRVVDDVDLAGDKTAGFEGYAMLWNVKDSYATTFRKGAFVSGGLDDSIYPFLLMHNKDKPIGIVTAVEDDRGVFIKGRFADTVAGQECRELAKLGAMAELSVGFERLSSPEDDNITSARLVEVSLITKNFASVPDAKLDEVRGKSLIVATHSNIKVRASYIAFRLKTLFISK